MDSGDSIHRTLYRAVPGLAVADALFESLDNVVYCVKNRRRQYVWVNNAFVSRLGLRTRSAVLGRTARELFPMPLAAGFEQQDDVVLRSGKEVHDRLERITIANGKTGWFLAHKVPVYDTSGDVVALVGISRDLDVTVDKYPSYAGIGLAIETIQMSYAEPLRVEDLAQQAGMTYAQFDRALRAIVHISPRQLLTKTRLDAAADALRDTDRSLGQIALACGFYDQATFCRQFRQATGLTPRQYRELSF